MSSKSWHLLTIESKSSKALSHWRLRNTNSEYSSHALSSQDSWSYSIFFTSSGLKSLGIYKGLAFFRRGWNSIFISSLLLCCAILSWWYPGFSIKAKWNCWCCRNSFWTKSVTSNFKTRLNLCTDNPYMFICSIRCLSVSWEKKSGMFKLRTIRYIALKMLFFIEGRWNVFRANFAQDLILILVWISSLLLFWTPRIKQKLQLFSLRYFLNKWISSFKT